MGFTVVENEIRTVWMPVHASDTVYSGQIVTLGGATPANEGVLPIGAAAGASDTTGKAIPFGVVIGVNDYEPKFDNTYKGVYGTQVLTQADQLARNFRGVEGQLWTKGNPTLFAHIAVIGPHTVLRGPIFNAAYGTAPSVRTVTTGSSDGLGFTASAADFTPVANNATHFFRTGANRGISQIGDDTSTTVTTNDIAFPYDIAVGDTVVSVNIRIGTCRAQMDSESTYIDTSAALTTDYYLINVLDMNLGVAGEEWADFTFNMDQFCGARA